MDRFRPPGLTTEHRGGRPNGQNQGRAAPLADIEPVPIAEASAEGRLGLKGFLRHLVTGAVVPVVPDRSLTTWFCVRRNSWELRVTETQFSTSTNPAHFCCRSQRSSLILVGRVSTEGGIQSHMMMPRQSSNSNMSF